MAVCMAYVGAGPGPVTLGHLSCHIDAHQSLPGTRFGSCTASLNAMPSDVAVV